MTIDFIILASKATEIDMSLWGLVLKGGWLMIPIFILSIIAIYIACERFWVIRKVGIANREFMRRLKSGEELYSLTQDSKAPITSIYQKGLLYADESIGEIKSVMEDEANQEIASLERGFSTLATCAGTAPMIGFLGTVIGMVQAFYDMSVAGNNIDITLLSRGIYTAMITTVAGLIVGIIANLAYNYLVSSVDNITHDMERAIIVFCDQKTVERKQ